ncbi:hypothetical protein BDV26DRAFT_259581 [Aspergillus bertholletiae]|uniref:FAD/NAD(P)-binding domain-containing protein n=1 Tax=Aspergillus bertholletiae TaxID=1226010 RepID=A0A5N7BC35_9EURO|nr:hypothetical protein BDV26DRAFT_259581 [Aspergillus bertholletiae]
MTRSSPHSDYDILIVGAGFSGIFLLYQLRQLGYKCKVYETAPDLGGVWYWNTYPGARVDTDSAVYQFSLPETWQGWDWKEKFPSREELQAYFRHLDQVLDIKKDVEFETRVVRAQFDQDRCRWKVTTEDGKTATARFFLPCVGTSTKRYVPDFPGLQSFQGDIYHSSIWPREGVDVKGKNVAVIGTGSTGVQIVQEWGKEAANLTVFQRTPNLALPMNQATWTAEDQVRNRSRYPQVFEDRAKTFSGNLEDFLPSKLFDAPAAEREALFEANWKKGGFSFILDGYSDVLFDEKVNREYYDFWAKKTRERIVDQRKKDILAPLEPVHPLGTKRPSLEQDYYEQFNRSTVDVVNLRQVDIAEIKPTGIATSDGRFYPVDAIAIATGFDAVTGPITNMGIISTNGTSLADEWRDGVHTYLGMASHGYPNMFWIYGTHGPTALSNGPVSIELQGQWVIDAIQKIDKSGLSFVEPTPEAEHKWKELVNQITNMTLLPKADSWYMGANIPGKKREHLNFPGGLTLYKQQCRQALDGWEGFRTV